MLKTMRKFWVAVEGYNKTTGEGAHELIQAYCAYKRKMDELERNLERVNKILEKEVK